MERSSPRWTSEPVERKLGSQREEIGRGEVAREFDVVSRTMTTGDEDRPSLLSPRKAIAGGGGGGGRGGSSGVQQTPTSEQTAVLPVEALKGVST